MRHPNDVVQEFPDILIRPIDDRIHHGLLCPKTHFDHTSGFIIVIVHDQTATLIEGSTIHFVQSFADEFLAGRCDIDDTVKRFPSWTLSPTDTGDDNATLAVDLLERVATVSCHPRGRDRMLRDETPHGDGFTIFIMRDIPAHIRAAFLDELYKLWGIDACYAVMSIEFYPGHLGEMIDTLGVLTAAEC